MPKSSSSYIYPALTSVSLLWGTSFAAAKIGMLELLPLNMVILRFALASTIFAAILLTMRKDNMIDRGDIPKFIILGFLTITSYFYFQYTGLQYTTTINSSLIIATSPIYVALFGAIIGWEIINKTVIAGIILAFAGVTIIITNGQLSGLLAVNTLKGDLFLFCNAIVWAGFTLYGKSILQKYRPFVAIAYIHIFGTLLLLPFAFTPNFFAAIPLVVQIQTISWSTMAAALYLALLCSVYGYYLWYAGIEKIGTVRTAVFSYLNPLFAIIAGVLLLEENLSIFAILGGLMVISGVYITNKAKTQQITQKI